MKIRFELGKKMLDLLYQASNSTGKSSGESQDVLRDPKRLKEQRNWLIEKWKNKVSAEQESRVFEILDCFQIDAYARGRSLPTSRYLLHP